MKCHIKKTCIWIQSNVSHSGQIVKPFIFFSSISSFPIPLTSSLSKLGLCDLMVFLPLVSFKLFHPSLQDKLSKNIALITPWAMCAKSFQSCLTLSDPMDCSPAGSSVYGSLQVRILEWVAMPSSRGPSPPRDRTHISYVSCTGRQVLDHYRHLGSPLILPPPAKPPGALHTYAYSIA